MTSKDEIIRHLQVFEIPPDASYQEVKNAYKELVQIYHPDRFQGNKKLQNRATKRLQSINESYKILKKFYEDVSSLQNSDSMHEESVKSPSNKSGYSSSYTDYTASQHEPRKRENVDSLKVILDPHVNWGDYFKIAFFIGLWIFRLGGGTHASGSLGYTIGLLVYDPHFVTV